MYGFIGAVLHIINHAFMKSALFLVIGGIQYRFGEINLYRLGGLNKKMTLSTITVTLAALRWSVSRRRQASSANGI